MGYGIFEKKKSADTSLTHPGARSANPSAQGSLLDLMGDAPKLMNLKPSPRSPSLLDLMVESDKQSDKSVYSPSQRMAQARQLDFLNGELAALEKKVRLQPASESVKERGTDAKKAIDIQAKSGSLPENPVGPTIVQRILRAFRTVWWWPCAGLILGGVWGFLMPMDPSTISDILQAPDVGSRELISAIERGRMGAWFGVFGAMAYVALKTFRVREPAAKNSRLSHSNRDDQRTSMYGNWGK